MPQTVFYSWQSDLSNSTNRSFIERALEKALKAIREDDSIQVDPVIDRDTYGVPGSPDIAATILAKIDQALAFVCDVSLVTKDASGRPMPNPNVLVELGYAIKTLGFDRIIMVMNSVYGDVELLPFDLRKKRVTIYRAGGDEDDAKSQRSVLESKLREGLQTIIEQVELAERPPNPTEMAISAIEESKTNQGYLTREFMNWLAVQLDSIAPDLSDKAGEKPLDEKLIDAIRMTDELVAVFNRVAESIAIQNAKDAGRAMYSGFGKVLEKYSVPNGFTGGYREVEFDFYKFMGHELFVCLIAFLIREERWNLIADLLSEAILVNNWNISKQEGVVSFEAISQPVQLFEIRKRRLESRQFSLHSDLLNERHSDTGASKLAIQDFVEADIFLCLRAELPKEEISWLGWVPWSYVYFRTTPRYLLKAYQRSFAQQLLAPFNLPDLDMLRTRLSRDIPRLSKELNPSFFRSNPFEGFRIPNIGSK